MNGEASSGYSEDWSQVNGLSVAAYAALAAFTLVLAHSGERWVPIVDSANLAFHEAGHLIVGLLNTRLGVYGGTLGQLIFPMLAAWAFHRQRACASLAFALLWLGENLFNIARYMADARARLLPLVGGGDHDWTEIFSRWHMLGSDLTVAALVRFVGWGIVLGTGVWLWRRYRADA